MSLTSSLQRIVTAKANIKTAIENKGVTVGDDVSIVDYPTYIGNISTGSSATLTTKTITANGTYNAEDDNADGYSSVTVNVSGGGGGSSDVPFDSSRYFEIPMGNIYDNRTVGKYCLGCPQRPDSSYSYVIGTNFCVYNTETREIVHSYTTSDVDKSMSNVLEYATGYYVVFISTWGNTQKPEAIWWYNSFTDTWTYQEDPAEITFSSFQARYTSVKYKGTDFGIVGMNGGGTGTLSILKPDCTIERFDDYSSSSSNVLMTYDNDYYYLAPDMRAVERYGFTYKVVRMAKNSEGTLYDVITYNASWNSSNAGVLFQCGRFLIKTGYSTTRYTYVYDLLGTNQPQIYYYGTKKGFAGDVFFDNDTQQAVLVTTNFVMAFDFNAYLNNQTWSYTYTGTTFTKSRCLLVNGNVYIGANTGFFKVTVGTGIALEISDTQNIQTAINLGGKSTDLIVAPSSSVGYFIYVYDTTTGTYTNLKTDQLNQSYMSISTNLWTQAVAGSGVYYAQTANSTGFIIYNSNSDEYIYIRRSGSSYSSRITDDGNYIFTAGMYGTDTYYSPYLIKKSGGYLTCTANTTSTSVPSMSYAWENGDKIYWQIYNSSPSADFNIICYDKTNDTLTRVYNVADNLYGQYFGYKDYAGAEAKQGDYYFFAYYMEKLDGKRFTTAQLSNVVLYLNTSNGTWGYVPNSGGGSCYIEQHYNHNLVIFLKPSTGYICTYNLTTGTETSTGLVQANLGSAKCMADGALLIKTTTNIYKYDLTNGTSTSLKTASSNSNSNNYGGIYALENLAFSISQAGGFYDSSTSTWTAMTNPTTAYSSSYYSSCIFRKLGSSRYVFAYKDSSNLAMTFGTFSSPTWSLNSYGYGNYLFDDTNSKYYIFYSSTNRDYDHIIIRDYDGTEIANKSYVSKPHIHTPSSLATYWEIRGKRYFYQPTRQSFYCIEDDEFFNLNTINGMFDGRYMYLQSSLNYTNVWFLELKKAYLFNLVYGSYMRTINGYSNRLMIVDTSETVTKAIGCWQPTQAELGGN